MLVGVLVSTDGSHDAHFERVVRQGNAHFAAMKPLFTDAYHTVPVNRLLLLTALRPCLEYASEVLVPTTSQSRALESVQLEVARMILGCPTLTASEPQVFSGDPPLLSSRRDVAKLKWQHRLQAMPESHFERFLYSQEVPTGVRGRKRRLLSEVCDGIWSSFTLFTRDWLDTGFPAFVTAIDAAAQESNTALLAGVLSTKPRLGLYNRVAEGASSKEYLLRHSDGQRAAKIRFRFWSGTSMLAHHRADYLRNHAHEEDSDACPTCAHADVIIMEEVPHVSFQCAAYAEFRTALFVSLRELAGAALFDAILALSSFERAASFMRDDFMSEVPDQSPAIHHLQDLWTISLLTSCHIELFYCPHGDFSNVYHSIFMLTTVCLVCN